MKDEKETLTETVEELREIIDEFLEEFVTTLTDWWETGKDKMPKGSDLIEKLKSKGIL